MKNSTRMLLLARGRDGGRSDEARRDYGRSDYDQGGGHMEGSRFEYAGGYGPDSRFRDRRGREHYDNGRFAPRDDGGMWVDSRYWDGREAYQTPRSHYPMSTPYVPPVYQEYGNERGGRPMNKIGFAVEGEMDRIPPEFDREYRTSAGHQSMDEMAYRQGGERRNGYGSGSAGAPFTREMATEWTQRMKNADGTTGPHWTMDKTEEARAQRGIDCDPLAFWVAMNIMYSDYVKAAEKVNCSSMDFYVYMAKAFLDDKDARHQGADKLARYYEYVVM